MEDGLVEWGIFFGSAWGLGTLEPSADSDDGDGSKEGIGSVLRKREGWKGIKKKRKRRRSKRAEGRRWRKKREKEKVFKKKNKDGRKKKPRALSKALRH